MLLGDTVVTSVHVLFDEFIPARSADYFKELEEPSVKVDPEERRVSDFDKECSEEDQRYVDNFPYRSMLGALLHLSMNTRPDISYAVGLLSWFGSKPTKVTCMLMVYIYIPAAVYTWHSTNGHQIQWE